MGTSMGFLYVLGHDGKPRAGWPLQMGEIQGQALVVDVNNDGEVEIVVGECSYGLRSQDYWALPRVDGEFLVGWGASTHYPAPS